MLLCSIQVKINAASHILVTHSGLFSAELHLRPDAVHVVTEVTSYMDFDLACSLLYLAVYHEVPGDLVSSAFTHTSHSSLGQALLNGYLVRTVACRQPYMHSQAHHLSEACV